MLMFMILLYWTLLHIFAWCILWDDHLVAFACLALHVIFLLLLRSHCLTALWLIEQKSIVSSSTNKNKSTMVEIVNTMRSPQLKARTRSKLIYFIKKIDDLGEWGNNHTHNFVMFATYVYHNKDRFPLSLIDQHERGVHTSQVHFSTKEVIVVFFIKKWWKT